MSICFCRPFGPCQNPSAVLPDIKSNYKSPPESFAFLSDRDHFRIFLFDTVPGASDYKCFELIFASYKGYFSVIVNISRLILHFKTDKSRFRKILFKFRTS